jgi:hypothetical protein
MKLRKLLIKLLGGNMTIELLRVDLNNVDQNNVANGPSGRTNIIFTNKVTDEGNRFNTETNEYMPQAGKIAVYAQTFTENGTPLDLRIKLNGIPVSRNPQGGNHATWYGNVNGNDVITVDASITGVPSGQFGRFSGSTNQTFMQAMCHG